MKSLKTIQKFSGIGRILSKIAFVLSMVGFCGCIAGLISLSFAEMLKGKKATYRELYAAFSEECDKEVEEIVLCGLSLGAVLALHYAIDHPDKVKALVLIAAQYKMPKKY